MKAVKDNGITKKVKANIDGKLKTRILYENDWGYYIKHNGRWQKVEYNGTENWMPVYVFSK